MNILADREPPLKDSINVLRHLNSCLRMANVKQTFPVVLPETYKYLKCVICEKTKPNIWLKLKFFINILVLKRQNFKSHKFTHFISKPNPVQNCQKL